MCGMRRPSTGHIDGDLSRLTSASSHSNGSVSSTQSIIHGNINQSGSRSKADSEINDSNNNNSSKYLPNFISPADWTNCRKRKERQDSTSSITQDRKLVRSNSEEHVPNCQEVIRRVASHEDFKKPNPLQQHNENEPTVRESEKLLKDIRDVTPEDDKNTGSLKEQLIDSTSRTRLIDVPTRSLRLSPSRDTYKNHHRLDEADHEHEKRRNSERFLKTRAPSGRKSPRKTSAKKDSNKLLDRDENLYKYDRNSIKHERRGFVSQRESIDETAIADVVHATQNDSSFDENEEQTTSEVVHPWNQSFTEDTPVVCQRFADHTFDHVHNSIAKYTKNDDYIRYSSLNEDTDKKTYFLNAENLKTRELMQKRMRMPAVTTFLAPDDRIKKINKRLASLKKKICLYEENFERDFGYRLSQADKTNDRSIKNYTAEIHKLKKEKSQIKSDPMAAMGYKSTLSDTAEADIKLHKMKDTLQEIEKRLCGKRLEENRPETLESMTPEQLIEEKTAIQRALLYLESMFGRPGTRSERDAARSLYDRYRFLKRMVNRSNSISGPCGGQELPTILENEALAFPTGIVTPSNDVTPPSANSAIQSPSDTSTSMPSSESVEANSINSLQDNKKLHSMSVEELWDHFNSVREEKKQMRRSIKEFEHSFEDKNGRKMFKSDRKSMEETYAIYKQKKAKLRLLDALVKKQMTT